MALELLHRIKSLPISEVIGHYINLKASGDNYTALCPFHNDRKPSLQVTDKKGLFKCFSCGVGGDAVRFVERYSNVPFKEALLEIAEKLGFPTDELMPSREKSPQQKIGERLNKAALKIFREYAHCQKPEKFQEFLEKRKISQDVSTQFALGYAPRDNILSHYISSLEGKDRKLAEQVAEKIGLVLPDHKRSGEFFDAFRERIIFPIWDYYDNVVGFGSRAIFDHQKAKYINSRESFLFHKKNILYGLNFAKKSIRSQGQVIVVEGYMDCLALVGSGYPYTVAVMGVAMSPSTVKMIAGMAKDVLLGFDSDGAGFKAAERTNELFLKQGVLPRYLSFKPHKDPDEFLKEKSPLDLEEIIEKAPTFLDVLIEECLGESRPKSTDKKARQASGGICSAGTPGKESPRHGEDCSGG